MRADDNLPWGEKDGPTQKVDLVADPRFVKFADNPGEPSDLRLSKDSPAIDGGVAISETWPDMLRAADAGKPGIESLGTLAGLYLAILHGESVD